MATQWFSWRTSGQRCPRRRWRGTCWRWSSSPWRGSGCIRPWCVPAALWSAWRLGRCHLWTRWLHRGSCCAPTLRPRSSTSPERRLRTGPFCQSKEPHGREEEERKWRLYSPKAGRGAALGGDATRGEILNSFLVHHQNAQSISFTFKAVRNMLSCLSDVSCL